MGLLKFSGDSNVPQNLGTMVTRSCCLNVVHGPASSASPGRWLGMQEFRPCSTESELAQELVLPATCMLIQESEGCFKVPCSEKEKALECARTVIREHFLVEGREEGF